MKLFAIADLHLRHESNRLALSRLPPHPNDWLIVAGDLGESEDLFHFAFSTLAPRFARLLWVPGNHDLWSSPQDRSAPRGEAKYLRLVEICRSYGVLTPEDPFVCWPDPRQPTLLAPMFLLYDYSFRPPEVAEEDVLAWAAETDVLCADEALLHAHPFPSRAAWCQARCELTASRLAEAAAELPLVLINHWPLRYDLVRLRRIPRFSPWCGTRLTEDWHLKYRARVVVHGHLHIRGTHFRDGVRFEEVSLGYPRDWDPRFGLEGYLREVLPGP